jgi:hypothetical protein
MKIERFKITETKLDIMYRCKGQTTEGKRCKRKTGIKDDYCPVHEEQRLKGAPTEIDAEPAISEITVFKDGDLTQRLCGHCCDLTLENCCECTDVRPADTPQRSDGYCVKCKTRLRIQTATNRFAQLLELLNQFPAVREDNPLQLMINRHLARNPPLHRDRVVRPAARPRVAIPANVVIFDDNEDAVPRGRNL